MKRICFFGIAVGLTLWCIRSPGAGPAVFRVSDPVGPDETALLFGDGLGADVRAEGWVLPDEPLSGPAEKPPVFSASGGDRLDVLQASELCAKVLLPATWRPGEYAIRLHGASGASSPLYLNRTEPWWWLGEPGHTAAPGGTIRVFGKNLGEKPNAWLAGNAKTIPLARVERKSPGPRTYDAQFALPIEVADGEYQLWVHNGHGGPLGFGHTLPVRVARPQPWPSREFHVGVYGAVGDGVADDTSALQAALAKAEESGGGVVYLPRGRYKITAKLVIPAKTVLRGEKRELVWLVVPKDLPEIETVLAGNGDFAVEDLSIVSQTARRLVVCPDYKTVYSPPWGRVPPDHMGHNAHLRRLRLHHLRYAHRLQGKSDPRRQEEVGPSTVLLAGPDMELADCEVVSPGMPLVLIESRHGRICGNRLDTGRNGWYGIWAAEETVFENNVIQGRDLEGSYGGIQGKAARLFIAGNHFRDAYGDEREALTFDTPYHPTWMGKLGAVHGDSLTAVEYDKTPKTWIPGALVGQVCLIAYGKGLGQYLPIVANTDTTITLAEPWTVTPDDTSHLVVRVDKSNVVIAGNTFADASAAVQLYSQSFGFILDGNTSVRTGGMYGIGWDAIDQRQRRRYSTCCFNQWLNNRLSEGFIYQQGAFEYAVVGPCAAGGKLDPPAVVAMGNVVRNNTMEDHCTTGAMYFAPHPFAAPESSAGYFGRDTVLEKNTISDTPLAIDVYPRYIDTLIRNNTIRNTAQPLCDDGQNTWIHPAQRLRYQFQAVRQALGAAFAGQDLESAIERLERQPATAAETVAASARLHRELWQAVASNRPQGVSPQLVAALTGLRYEFVANSSVMSALAGGKGGKADVAIRARTQPWSPAVDVALEVVPPPGWQAMAGAGPMTVRPGVLVNLTAVVQLPEQADVQQLPVKIKVVFAGMPLVVEDRFDVSQRNVLNWLVLGPLPNKGGTLPDTGAFPAETRLDAGATYDGLAGTIAWQPLALGNRFLHFDQLWKPKQPATALAVACLRVERPTMAVLQLHCRGAAEFSLSGGSIAKIDPPSGGKTVRVELHPGDNLLVCKASFLTGPWEIAVDVKPLEPGQAIRQLPAAELPKLEALRPRPPQSPKRARPEHSSGAACRVREANRWEMVGCARS